MDKYQEATREAPLPMTSETAHLNQTLNEATKTAPLPKGGWGNHSLAVTCNNHGIDQEPPALTGIPLEKGDFRGLTREELQELTTRSDVKAVLLTLGQFLLYLTCLVGAIADYSIVGNIISSIGVGFSIGQLFIIGHDACHQALAKSSILNKIIGRFCFSFALHSYSLWAIYHNQLHHHFTNIKSIDPAWTPLNKTEFDQLLIFKKVLYRMYRSFAGAGIYYLCEIWLYSFIPFDPNLKPNILKFMADSIYLTISLISQILLTIFLGKFLGTHKAIIEMILLGWLLPFLVWNQLGGIVTYIMHTHPMISWHISDFRGGYLIREILSTPHIQFSKWVDYLPIPLSNVMEHTAHHLYTRIPLYNLSMAQKLIEERNESKIIKDSWSLSKYLEITRICKLYDFDRNCWTDFDGNPTAPPIPKFRDDKIITLTGNP